MIEQLSIFTYYKLSATERLELGITDTLIRLSVGVDDSADSLLTDLSEALFKAHSVQKTI